MFIGLLIFTGSLAIKYISFTNEPCMVAPTLIDLNPSCGTSFLYIHD